MYEISSAFFSFHDADYNTAADFHVKKNHSFLLDLNGRVTYGLETIKDIPSK